MSIEFVEPEPRETRAAAPIPAPPPRAAAWPGRVLAGVTLLAAVLTGVATQLTLYVVDRTAFVVDFDGTSTQDARIPYDAFGGASTAPLTSGGTSSTALSVSLDDGVAYAPWWLGLAGVLLVAGVWAALRPRSTRPAALVGALGGLLLGSVGAAWLAIRTVDRDSVPQIRFAALPAPGLWLVAAAGVLALLTGLLAATRPSPRRLLPRRRA